MTTSVHIWLLSPSNVGHVSLTIDATYASFWPGDAAGKKDFKIGRTHKPAFPASYKTDKRLEGRDCDKTVVLNGLQEALMIDAWETFKADPKHYNMVNQNCSTIAAWLLEIGSGLSPTIDKGIRINEWVTNPVQRFVFKLRYLGNQIDMWTPDDVWRYALQVKSYMGP